MVSLTHYQLILFDFDGLLVNTERLHWLAYEQLCSRYGLQLNWDLKKFVLACHRESTGARDAIYGQFPQLQKKEPQWEVLYRQKSEIYTNLLKEGRAELMPGVARLLEALQAMDKKRVVVTHSQGAHVTLLRHQYPILNTIPYWVTREDYTHPKPHPQCYQVAMERYAKQEDQLIGFEDTPRGILALQATRAQPVIVCPCDYPLLKEALDEKTLHLTSLEKLL